MTDGAVLIVLALSIPLFGAAAARALNSMPDVRDTVTIVAAIMLSVVAISLLTRTSAAGGPELVLAQPLQGLALSFKLEPLGALFATMASFLWTVNSLFSIGYMRGRNEPHQRRFYMCFALAMFGTMGLAMASNLFTLFVFYEVLTFATYPLVTHAGDEPARRAGRIYLLTLVGASTALLLPAIIVIQVVASSTDFLDGGLLEGRVEPWLASLLLVMLVFGTAKAAMIPLHGWLPAAMAAPTPVSALLHAVAVVKAGVFTLLKVSAMTFGPALMAATPATQWLLWLAAAAIVFASLVALGKDDLKARLAWSTIAQLAFVTAGALMAGAGFAAGGLHMLTHAFGKITLFMCAGAIYVTANVTNVSQMRGLGRRMPVVFICFLVGAASVVGLPPFGGMWSKFLLVSAGFGAGQQAVAWAMIVSSMLSLFYLLPVGVRGLLPPEGDAPASLPRRKPLVPPGLLVAPIIVTAVGTIVLFFFADSIVRYLGGFDLGAAP